MAGTQEFTLVQYGKETTPGTPVAPTRIFAAEGTAVLDDDRGWNLHENENRGRRSEIGRAPTQQTEDVVVNLRSYEGVAFDDLMWPFSDLNGTATGTGAGADKSWAQTPSMTASNSPKAYSLDIGSDVQNWRVQYAMWRDFEIRAGRGQLTQLSGTMFGQRSIKTARAALTAVSPQKIAGDWWTVKIATTFAGLPGASVQANLVVSLRLKVRTGLIPRHYLDGNYYFGQHQELRIGGELELELEDTATTITEFYDRYTAGTMFYLRLRAQGPTLGGSAYAAQFDLPIVTPEVKIIDREDNGVNIFRINARLSDDMTNPPITPLIVNTLAALP